MVLVNSASDYNLYRRHHFCSSRFSDMSDNTSPRVNSARLSDYVGRHVRLAAKVLKAGLIRIGCTMDTDSTL